MNIKITAKIAMLLMVLDALSLTLLDSAQKYLGEFYPSPQVVLMYKGTVFLCILPWVFYDGIGVLRTKMLHLHIVRSLLSVLGVLMVVISLQHVAIADLSALLQLQSVFLTAISMLFFGEKFSKTKVSAILIACIGAIIVARPEMLSSVDALPTFNPYYFFVLLAVTCFVMNSVTIKLLGRTENNKTQLFYITMFATIWSSLFLLIKWDKIDVFGTSISAIPSNFISLDTLYFHKEHIGLIIFTMVCYVIHNMSYYNALRADLGLVMPFKYLKIVFAAILGYVLFNETGHIYSYVGYALIIFAGLMTSNYIHKKQSSAKKAKKQTASK